MAKFHLFRESSNDAMIQDANSKEKRIVVLLKYDFISSIGILMMSFCSVGAIWLPESSFYDRGIVAYFVPRIIIPLFGLYSFFAYIHANFLKKSILLIDGEKIVIVRALETSGMLIRHCARAEKSGVGRKECITFYSKVDPEKAKSFSRLKSIFLRKEFGPNWTISANELDLGNRESDINEIVNFVNAKVSLS